MNYNQQALVEFPSPQQMFNLVEDAADMMGNGFDRARGRQPIQSQRLSDYESIPGQKTVSHISGFVLRNDSVDHRHALWRMKIVDHFETPGERQHTSYNFRWDESEVYYAGRDVKFVGSTALEGLSIDELEERAYRSTLDMDGLIEGLLLKEESSLRTITAADCELLVEQIAKTGSENRAILRARRGV